MSEKRENGGAVKWEKRQWKESRNITKAKNERQQNEKKEKDEEKSEDDDRA